MHPIHLSTAFVNHLGRVFSSLNYTQTVGFLGRGDQPVARSLSTQRTTQTQNKRIITPNIYALSGIRTNDPIVCAREECSCLRPRGHIDQRRDLYISNIADKCKYGKYLGRIKEYILEIPIKWEDRKRFLTGTKKDDESNDVLFRICEG
jgi:hypothetical protein